ncbi:putative low-complexity protein [Rivularia sp. PCC 7116]|nr:putative low-complexity protein [Rivularia sp. PCC 7116]
MEDERYRAFALSTLAAKLPPEFLNQVLAVARNIEDDEYRAEVLIALSDKLPELLPEALAAIREIHILNNYGRKNLLQAFVEKLLPHDSSLNQVSQSFANLEGAILINADLSKVDLRRGNLRKANFNNANLEGAFLNNADLSQAKLIQTNLRYANLRDAHFVNATLIGANLANANLIGANLIDADLSGANVENAKFGHNQGISDDMRRNLEGRGAIFVDEPPREDSRVLVSV